MLCQNSDNGSLDSSLRTRISMLPFKTSNILWFVFTGLTLELTLELTFELFCF